MRGTKALPHEIDRSRNRLHPEGNRSRRVEDLRLVGNKAVLLDQITGELGETVTIAVTMKDRPEHSPPIAIGVRGSPTRPVLYGDVHHAANLQTPQMKVSEVG